MTIDYAKIAETVNRMHLPSGLGDKENACSIAAINLALTGELTDHIPACMSDVIGHWIIVTQDGMPDELRNSARWKGLLPLAAGTGRDYEKERVEIILDHMWTVTLPMLQPLADDKGFGDAWRRMTTERTAEAAEAAWEAAARMAASAWAAWEAASAAARAAWGAAWAAWAEILDRAFTGFVALPAPEQPFQVLGVGANASREEVERAYRLLASKHHPDRGGDPSMMARINQARDALMEG